VGYSPLVTGVAFLPISGGLVVASIRHDPAVPCARTYAGLAHTPATSYDALLRGLLAEHAKP
jgi:hypothetical protein